MTRECGECFRLRRRLDAIGKLLDAKDAEHNRLLRIESQARMYLEEDTEARRKKLRKVLSQ